MITAVETATMLHLYEAVPSLTATRARPAQHRGIFAWPNAPRANTTFVPSAAALGVSAIGELLPPVDSQRTPGDLVIEQLLRMENWNADWDGSGAAKPLDLSVKDARAFIRRLAPESVIPSPTLHADGHAMLFVSSADTYAELEFLEGRRIGFYVRRGGQEWTDEVDFADGHALPEGLLRAGFVV